MPTKIRLQRKGKKGRPFYHLVVADGRAPRDGKFIERLGTYDPMTNPATVEMNFDRALYWVQVGAQPTDTARSILSREGVMLKDHLLRGVKKGALTEEAAEEKFQDWLKEKASKIEQVAKDAELSQKELKKKLMEDERKINEARAESLAKKAAKESLKEEAKEEAEEVEAVAEETAEAKTEEVEKEEAPAEEPKAEKEAKEEAPAEEPKAEKEVKEEAPAEEPKAEKEAKEEAPAEEPKAEKEAKEEAPAEEPKAEEKAEKKSEAKAADAEKKEADKAEEDKDKKE